MTYTTTTKRTRHYQEGEDYVIFAYLAETAKADPNTQIAHVSDAKSFIPFYRLVRLNVNIHPTLHH